MKLLLLISLIQLSLVSANPSLVKGSGVRIDVFNTQEQPLSEHFIPHPCPSGKQFDQFEGEIVLKDSSFKSPFQRQLLGDAMKASFALPALACAQGDKAAGKFLATPLLNCVCCAPCAACNLAYGATCCATAACLVVVAPPIGAMIGTVNVGLSRKMIYQGEMDVKQMQEQGMTSHPNPGGNSAVQLALSTLLFRINLDDHQPNDFNKNLKNIQLELAPTFGGRMIQWSVKRPADDDYTPIQAGQTDPAQFNAKEFTLKAEFSKPSVTRRWKSVPKSDFIFKLHYKLSVPPLESSFEYQTLDQARGSLHTNLVQDSEYLSGHFRFSRDPVIMSDPYWYEFISMSYHHPPAALAQSQNFDKNQWQTLFRIASHNGSRVLQHVKTLFDQSDSGREVWSQMSNAPRTYY